MDRKNYDLMEIMDQSGSVIEKVEKVFTRIIKVLTDPDLRLECFIISSAIEQAPHD